MALPGSGPLSFSQINVELSRSSSALISLSDPAVRNLAERVTDSISLTHLLGKSSIIARTIAASANNLSLQDLFSAEEWAASTPKQVTIQTGVVIGSVVTGVAALVSGSSMGGTLHLINNGSILGKGGVPNSGAGGHALEVAVALMVTNNGEIKGGGGAGGLGGQGGQGGPGYYTNVTRDPGSGDVYSSHVDGKNTVIDYGWNSYTQYATGCVFIWGGQEVWSSGTPGITSASAGGWTYYTGRQISNSAEFGDVRAIYREAYSNVYTSGGPGGGGGNGGSGAGFNQSRGGGSAGAGGGGGGANAGWGGIGGQGGIGGDWGQPGSAGLTGATGNGGNNGGGYGGATGLAGGAAGRAVNYLAGGSVSWLLQGTLVGAA